MRDRIFISYSHHDGRWLEMLKDVLAPLIRTEQLTIWDDKEIRPGAVWREEIRSALASARVAVLLVTPDLLKSKFVNDEEMPVIFESAKNGSLKVLWVAVKASLYQETPLRDLQCTNDPARPLYSLKGSARNKELVNIAEAIKAAFINGGNRVPPIRDTWIVDQNERDDPVARKCRRVNNAVRNAVNNALILVKKGIHKEAIVLDKPLELVGDGDRETIIIESFDNDTSWFNTDEGCIAKLTIKHLGNSRSGVRITRGKLRLEDCDLTSGGLSCISIQHGAEPFIKRNKIHNGRQEGIYSGDHGREL
jgi:hypothetical protein